MRNLSVILTTAVLCFAASPLAAQSFSVQHNFTGGGDGGLPTGTPITITPPGYIYGTTSQGGSSNLGTIYRIQPATGQTRTLYSFAPTDGHYPTGIMTHSGSTLYGVTQHGGTNDCGTVFSFTVRTGLLQTLYQFQCGNDGAYPNGRVVLYQGTLYGTTFQGGSNGQGTIWALPVSGGYDNVLYSFTGGNNDGAYPAGGVNAVNGVLYGTTTQGGPWNNGEIFRLTLNNNGSIYQALHFFTGGTGYPLLADGAGPLAAPVMLGGALYGTTPTGGTNNTGTVYRMSTATGEVLQSYSVGDSGGFYGPVSSLTALNGVLYGVAPTGGYGAGVVFGFNPQAKNFTITHYFNGGDGYQPLGGLTTIGGTLFGTASQGGANYPDTGTFFSLTP